LSSPARYPECEKLRAAAAESQKIGQFLDWLFGEKECVLAKWVNHEHDDECYDNGRRRAPTCGLEDNNDNLVVQRMGTEKLLAEYFGINMDVVEQERRAILEELRRANG
jgi:hypothetical protein